MNLTSGHPFWAIKNGLMYTFPQLSKDVSCDVAVIGGGITSALISSELEMNGHEVVVLERRDIGWGSSAASTALLQYEIDHHLIDLAQRYGLESALLAYRSCADALDSLQSRAETIGDVDFGRMRSLYYASRPRDRSSLLAEFNLRKQCGFSVSWLEPGELSEQFDFQAPAAILSEQAARLDPYRMAYRLFQGLHRRGTQIFDRTAITDLTPHARSVELRTDQGHSIRARWVVIAAGYESQEWLRSRVAQNRSSYALITDPIAEDQLGRLRDTMMWETARPYLYLRTTGEGRLLIGGEDDSVDIAKKRDERMSRKTQTLLRKAQRLFPRLPLSPAFSWAGTFAETKDGLPFFGPHAEHGSRVLFAMAYGGNGITYSMLGAALLRAHIERHAHPLARLFSFERLRKHA